MLILVIIVVFSEKQMYFQSDLGLFSVQVSDGGRANDFNIYALVFA